MNAPRDLGPEFRAWMDDGPPMPDDLLERTLRRTQDTRQRRRWLWFLPGPRPTAGAGDERATTQRPAPILEYGGLMPAQIGGTRTMLSATKVIGLAAVAAVAGALLLTVPGNVERDEALPAARLDGPVEITPVSGTFGVMGQERVGDCQELEADWFACTNDVWIGKNDFDDDRLDGMLVSRHNRYAISERSYAAQSLTTFIENGGGSWAGSGYAYQDPTTSGLHYRMVLHGQDGYEGLTAIIDLDQSGFSSMFRASGVIVGPGLPEMPEPAPAEVLAVPAE
jgi:hypothetical protein